MRKWLRNKVISFLTKNLLKAVTNEEILVITGKEWLVGKRKLSRDEIIQIREEAQMIESSLFWKLLVKELKYEMTLQRYDHATTADDMIFGKSMAYSISQIELFIKKIKEL